METGLYSLVASSDGRYCDLVHLMSDFDSVHETLRCNGVCDVGFCWNISCDGVSDENLCGMVSWVA